MFIINKSFFSFENNLQANCMIDVTTKIKLGWKSKIYYLNFHFLQQKVDQPCSWNCHSWIKLSSDVPVYKLDLIYLETKIIQMYYTVTSTKKQLVEHMNLNRSPELVFYLGLKRDMVFFFLKGHFAHRIYQKGHIEKIG
jgi:hypothetical protein